MINHFPINRAEVHFQAMEKFPKLPSIDLLIRLRSGVHWMESVKVDSCFVLFIYVLIKVHQSKVIRLSQKVFVKTICVLCAHLFEVLVIV